MNDTAKMMAYDAKKKSVGLAYMFWFILGGLGVHRFYTGRAFTGTIYVLLQIAGWLTIAAGFGVFLFAIIFVWWAIDGFLLPGIVRRTNLLLAAEITGGTPLPS